MKLFAALAGLRCSDCSDRLEGRLETFEGLRWARAHLATGTLALQCEPRTEEADLLGRLRKGGFQVLGIYPRRSAAERAGVAYLEEAQKAVGVRLLASVVLGSLAWTSAWTGLSPYSLALISLALLLACGGPLQAALVHAVGHRRADAESLLALSAWAALGYTLVGAVSPELAPDGGQLAGWLAATVAAALAADWTEARSRRLAGQAAERLTRCLPSTARVLRGGRELRRPIEELAAGETVVVLPGEPVPVDGEVLEGASSVDESLVLGEGEAVEKTKGSRVLAGTANRSGRLVVSAARWAEASLLGSIVESVRDAQSSRATPPSPTDLTAANVGLPVAIVLAGCAAAWSIFEGRRPEALLAALAALTYAVPPGLLFALPVARVAASRRGFKWVEPDAAERAADLDIVVMGRTGLLSAVKPRVAALHASPGTTEKELLSLALVAAGVPEYAYADAVRRFAEDRPGGHAAPPLKGLDYYPGRGVRAVVGGEEVWIGSPDWIRSRGIEGDSVLKAASMWVARGGKVLGSFEFVTGLRAAAPKAVADLRKRGLEVVLASGDAEAKVRETAKALGVQTFHWGVSPSDQLALVTGLQARGKRVAAVGRGLLDAPVVAQADLGFSLREGLPADVTLSKAEPGAVPAALENAALCRRASRAAVGALLAPQWAAAAAAVFGSASELSAVAAAGVGLAASCAAAYWSSRDEKTAGGRA